MITSPRTAFTCVACRGTRSLDGDYVVGGRFPLQRCADCGMGRLEIAESADEDFDEYWDEVAAAIYAAPAVVAELRQKYRRYFGTLARLAPNRRFLDVGSGAGISVHTAQEEFGFDARGIEPSARAVELSRARLGVEVTRGLLGVERDLPRDFGALTLWDVVEHVGNPEDLLRECHDHLAPGGVFLLETPDEDALLRRLIRGLATLGVDRLDARGSIYYRAHRFYFTRRAMRGMLERCGFRQVRFHTEHTMYEKELLYTAHYSPGSKAKRFAVRTTANLTRVFPHWGTRWWPWQ